MLRSEEEIRKVVSELQDHLLKTKHAHPTLLARLRDFKWVLCENADLSSTRSTELRITKPQRAVISALYKNGGKALVGSLGLSSTGVELVFGSLLLKRLVTLEGDSYLDYQTAVLTEKGMEIGKHFALPIPTAEEFAEIDRLTETDKQSTESLLNDN